MTSTAYTCKLCRRTGVASYDETAPISDLSKWLPLLHCNHCSDWLEAKNRLTAKIAQLCRIIQVGQAWHPTKPEQVRERTAKLTSAANGLEVITKAMAGAACNYFHLTNVWEQDFADLLAENPAQHPRIITDYLRRLSKMVKPRQDQFKETL